MTADALRLAWERLRRLAGITDLHFHDLRHEAISWFFEKGLSVPEVALISGTVRALARPRPAVLPSASVTASAPRRRFFRGSIAQPMLSPTEALPAPSRVRTHGSGVNVARYAFIAEDLHLLLFANLPAHCHTAPSSW